MFTRFAPLAAVVALLGPKPDLPAQDTAAARPAPLVATLSAVDSRIYGEVRIEASGKPNELRARITVRGSVADAQMPWEIRVGTCGERGQQVGPQASYRTISIQSDGTGMANANLPISLDPAQTYSVNVMASRTNRERVVACGVLIRP